MCIKHKLKLNASFAKYLLLCFQLEALKLLSWIFPDKIAVVIPQLHSLG